MAAASTGQAGVRLIGGLWKRSRLPAPAVPGLRPTPDRVRETLFNWLGQDLRGWRVLDAFSGSGALGFEAASRGALSVRLLERHPLAVRALRASAQRLQAQTVEILQTDALGWMATAAADASASRYDLILLDPPFDAGVLTPAAALATRLLVPGGWLYTESADSVDFGALALQPWRSLRAGAVYAALWRMPAAA